MQNSYDKYEEEINIFALLWFVFSKWKSILIVAIIGLVLGAGYAALSAPDASTVADGNGAVEEEAEVSAYDAAKQTYEAALERVDTLEQYLAEAAIMQINPYELYQGTVSYVIGGEQKNLVGVDAQIYSYVADGELIADLEDVGPYTAKELKELLTISQSKVETIVTQDGAVGQTFVRVSVIAGSEIEAQKLLEQMEASLDNYLGLLQEQQDIIEYTRTASSIRESTSTALADHQSNIRSKYDSETTNIDTYKSNMEAAQSEVVLIDASGGISKTALIKYAGVGFVGGIVIAAIVWILIYFLCGRLYTVSDKERKFDVKQLGSIHDFGKANSIDRWIGQRLNGVYSALPLDEQRKIALLNIKNELQKDTSIKKVFLVSSCTTMIKEPLILKVGLESAGYTVEGCENVIGRADVLKRVAQCDAVVILENNTRSKIALIEAEVNALKEYVDKVLGMVVIQSKE